MTRRLYWRLYLALLAVALSCLLAVAFAYRVIGGPPKDPADRLRTAVGVVAQAVPEMQLPEESGDLAALADDLGVDLVVWSARGEVLAAATMRPFTAPRRLGPGWRHRERRGLEIVMALSNDRFLGVRPRVMPTRRPQPFFLSLIALAALMAVGSYPVARWITRRIEDLASGVERWGAGDLAHRVAVQGQDEVGRLAASFNVAAAQVEGLVAQQREMLANTSHQLRSPLARLRMGLELLEEEQSVAQRQRLLESARRDVHDLDDLIEEVLLIARADDRASRRPFELVNLKELLESEAARTGAAVEAAAISVRGDAMMLRHMVRNLLENAHRHGENKDVRAFLETTADAVVVAVEDRGPGVPGSERERIFAPFHRLARGEGTGLGLALVRQVAHHHGGRALVRPREGGGSRFEVVLPGASSAGTPAL